MATITARQQFLTEEESRARLAAPNGGPPPVSFQPPVSNARLGMLMLIAAETMLFVGLIGSYLMFRLGSVAWPSAHLYLPIGVTWFNTAVLVVSGYTMHSAVSAARVSNPPLVLSRLRITTFLGILFLSVQGYEWFQLIRDGLTISTGIYGATFYTLIGCHALHVLAAVVWLSVLLGRARKHVSLVQIDICRMYWHYVCALWVVLFALVYLN